MNIEKMTVHEAKKLIADLKNHIATMDITEKDIVAFAIFEFCSDNSQLIVIPSYNDKFILTGACNSDSTSPWDTDSQPFYTKSELVQKFKHLDARKTNKVMKVMGK
jgi:hypothetical protein